jgi:hypothetical protein
MSERADGNHARIVDEHVKAAPMPPQIVPQPTPDRRIGDVAAQAEMAFARGHLG